jgi:hypothetical protein
LVRTAPALAVKVDLVAPAGTTANAGTLSADGSVLTTETVVPAPGAAFEIVTVQRVDVEEARIDAAQLKEETDIALTVIGRDLVVLPRVADSTGLRFVVTEPAVTVKLAVVAFAATVTEAGTVRAVGMLLARLTAVPPAGAAFERVTEQLAEPPVVSETLVHDSVESDSGGITVIANVFTPPFKVALTLAV